MLTIENKYQDVIKELVNIGIGKGALTLNKLLKSHIELSVPDLLFLSGENANHYFEKFGDNILSVVNMPFSSDISGSAKLIFTTDNAAKLVGLFMKNTQQYEGVDFDIIRSSALMEIGNIVINSIVGTISNQLKFHLKYSVPNYEDGLYHNIFLPESNLDNWMILVCKTSFIVQSIQVEGTFILTFEIASLNFFIDAIEKLYPGYIKQN